MEAFWTSVAHARPIVVGLNCALGAQALRPHMADLARVAPIPVSVYPNAGLPNEFGGYDDTPKSMAHVIGGFARDGLVNIAGGCCGTTPAHVRAIAEAVAGLPPLGGDRTKRALVATMLLLQSRELARDTPQFSREFAIAACSSGK